MHKKTVVITGASRGIGAAIAKKLAILNGWNVAILAKTDEPHPKLPGTIYTVAAEIEKEGGFALPLKVDVRFKDQVERAVEEAVGVFGGIDALINNASALFLRPSEKQVQLMRDIIVDGARYCTEACLPYLLRSGKNPHVLNIAPSLPMAKHWIDEYGEYAKAKRDVGKYTAEMSQKHPGIIFSTLWPAIMIYTAATIHLFGEKKARQHTRDPEIMADAAALILHSCKPGTHWFDEGALKQLANITDLDRYLMPGSKEEDLAPDVFV